jgi:membrane-bound lytic murein transglycosylase F
MVVGAPHLAPRTLDDLRIFPLALHPSSAAWLLAPDTPLTELGATVTPVPEEMPMEELLRQVGNGRYSATVVSSSLLDHQSGSAVRVLGPVAGRRPQVWAVRASSTRLRAAVDDFLFAEQVLSRTARPAACRDLEQIRTARTLRLVTRISPTTCSIEDGGEMGFEYELVHAFALHHRLRLELSIPPPETDPLDWLENGYGDLAALHEPLAPEHHGRFKATRPVRSVDLVSLFPAGDEPPAAVEDLAGRRITSARPVAALCSLLPLEPPIEPEPLPAGSDGLTALHRVARGDGEIAVVDGDLARIEVPQHPELRQGPTVMHRVPLVWVVNPSSTHLLAALETFLADAESSGFVRQLALARMRPPQTGASPPMNPHPRGPLSPYDDLLRAAGRSHGIDWRLLAALMYEESRFDPQAQGPGGAMGLFQLMPLTCVELGVTNPHDPAQAIEAGARYLRDLIDLFPELPMPDSVAMALAAYNAGPGHVLAARRLAGANNLDADRWSGGVERAMLMLSDAGIADTGARPPCPCRRAVHFSRRILRRYQAYTEQYPPA